jgi:heat-inducible transcriptional repressor
MNKAVEAVINERAQHFLKVLIERYIRDGQPVGSRTLAKDAGLELSPATIRNVMADLEDLGFVVSPHTSAGRIPTISGYRLFVDSLLSLKPLNDAEVSRVQGQLKFDIEPRKALASASQLLSELTHMAGVVSLPRREQVVVRQIEFVPLSGTRVLVVLVTGQGEVSNRLIETARAYSRSELEQAANFINQHYAGRELESLRAQIVREMADDRAQMDQLMAQALEMAQAALSDDEPADSDFVLAGQTNLMDFDELAQMDRLRQLFNAFTEKQEILHLLDRCTAAEGVQIFIGEESGYQTLEKCSVITAPYAVDDQVVGVLGVIGPTRMAYDRVIPIVDVTARLLGAALKNR